jgi:putative DNA primase/helicase
MTDKVIESSNVTRIEELAAKRRARAQQSAAPAAGDNRQPVALARQFAARYECQGLPGLLYFSGALHRWTGTHWTLFPVAALRAAAYGFLDEVGAKAHRHAVSDLIDALAGIAFVDLNPPSYLPGHSGGDPTSLLSLSNGLLHVPSRTLYPHDPAFITTSCAPVAWDPDARCARWVRFLADAIPDESARLVFQQFFGLLVASNMTKYQRALMLLGPPRSGKGTILRVLPHLVGQAAIAAPMLSHLGSRFGPSALVGKTVGLITDARLPPGGEGAAALEMLLRITGEDQVIVESKFGAPESMKLPTRLVLASNELPLLLDSSGAAASRFVIVRMGGSHVGHEDLDLDAALAAEAPGIFRWAVDGLAMLERAGRFIQPADAQALLDELRDSGSPMLAFIRDQCRLDPTAETAKSVLFARWEDWCRATGRTHAGNDSLFARQLLSAAPGVSPKRPTDSNGNRYQAFAGIGIAP